MWVRGMTTVCLFFTARCCYCCCCTNLSLHSSQSDAAALLAKRAAILNAVIFCPFCCPTNLQAWLSGPIAHHAHSFPDTHAASIYYRPPAGLHHTPVFDHYCSCPFVIPYSTHDDDHHHHHHDPTFLLLLLLFLLLVLIDTRQWPRWQDKRVNPRWRGAEDSKNFLSS